MMTNQELVPLQQSLNADNHNNSDTDSENPLSSTSSSSSIGLNGTSANAVSSKRNNNNHNHNNNGSKANRARVANENSDENSPTSFLHFEDEEELNAGAQSSRTGNRSSASSSSSRNAIGSRLLHFQEYLPQHPPHFLDGLSHGVFHPSPRVNQCFKTSLVCLLLAFMAWTFFTFLLTSSLKLCWSSADELRILDKSRPVQGPIPLRLAHSHNDYLQSVPLWEALHAGFCSVEADVHLVDDRLMLGHSTPGKTSLLEIYLEPMAALVRKNGGFIFQRSSRLNLCQQVSLLIDFKALDKVAAWSELERLLASPTYALDDGTRMFEAYASGTGEIIPNPSNPTRLSPIKVIVSGIDAGQVIDLAHRMLLVNHTIKLDVPDPALLALNSEVRKTVGWVSQRWMYQWPPLGANGKNETAALVRSSAETVALALGGASFLPSLEHGRRYVPSVRYWDTPEDPELWQMLLDAGVDLLNTDHVLLLRAFLLGRSLGDLE